MLYMKTRLNLFYNIEHGIIPKTRLFRIIWKTNNVKLLNDEVLEKSKNEKYFKLVADSTDITDEEGLKQAYESKDGLHQHYNKLFIAGRDWPGDAIDDLKLQ